MRRTALAAALLGSLALAGSAHSQTAPAPRDVTRAEYIAQAEARFAALDTNRDGVLSAAERDAGGPRPLAGPASRPGGGRGMGGGIAALDTDKDGRITRAEFDAGTGARMGRAGGGGAGGAEMSPEAIAERTARRFDRLDTSRDGVLDAAELEAARQRRPGARQP